MQKSKGRYEVLHLTRAAVAFLAMLIAAAHLAYATQMSAFSSPTHTSNQISTGQTIPMQMSFNELGFWFDVEVIAYGLIAVVFLLGLRTWYPLSMIFNAFNLGIYFLSGVTAIPGISMNAFPGRFNLMFGLSSINIIIVCWILVLILGLALFKYDPGSQLDELLATRKTK